MLSNDLIQQVKTKTAVTANAIVDQSQEQTSVNNVKKEMSKWWLDEVSKSGSIDDMNSCRQKSLKFVKAFNNIK